MLTTFSLSSSPPFASFARAVLLEVVALFGLVLDPAKTPLASTSEVVLGVRVSFSERSVVFEVARSKLDFWLQLLRDLLEAGEASSLDIAKISGRLSFGCWAVWGPGARSRLAPFNRPFGASRGRLSAALAEAASWWVAFLASVDWLAARHRLTPWPSAPYVLYTDAEGSGGVGAVLYSPGVPPRWFGGSVPPAIRRRVARRWGYTKCPIFLLEAAVPLLCLRLYGPFLRGHRLLVFVDNSTALFALRKGRSRLSPPLNEMCFSFWAAARSMSLDLTLVWVPTRFNVADDPSRGEPPVGVEAPADVVADSLWERAFRPALRP